MKHSTSSKSLPFFLLLIITVVAFVGCSKDEPKNSDINGAGFGTEAMIPYSTLKGTWIIESIQDSKTGKETEINQTVYIGDFTPKQESSNVVTQNGYQFWGESYFDLLSYTGLSGEKENAYVIMGFCKEQNKGLLSSLLYEITFTTSSYNENTSLMQGYVLTDFRLSGKELLAKNSVYNYVKDTNSMQIVGTIKMIKL